MKEFSSFVEYLESLRKEKEKNLQEASINAITEEIKEAIAELEEELENLESETLNLEEEALSEARSDEFARKVAQAMQNAFLERENEYEEEEDMKEVRHRKNKRDLLERGHLYEAEHEEEEMEEHHEDDEELDIDIDIEDLDEDGDIDVQVNVEEEDEEEEEEVEEMDEEDIDLDINIKGAVESEKHMNEEMQLLNVLLERVEEAISLLREMAESKVTESRYRKVRQSVKNDLKRRLGKLRETRVVKPTASENLERVGLDMERIKRLAGL